MIEIKAGVYGAMHHETRGGTGWRCFSVPKSRRDGEKEKLLWGQQRHIFQGVWT
ncbi:hypothetical protein FHY12_001124 [Xanthomonas arboricola]|uniref:hypothetical protein n=1 Tax=Xanthomonas euroxanthea TaxID=2259622 RepID=UPI00141ABAC9|nr:hypothetical protein [Xanthomonas euroxanthea]NIK09633.1 hypothetical protein [Xanthomonas euroxanthea]NIK38839.1 hypothetical protein [Xanthomonas euroxanthea]